jgi:transcription initiation factor IIE alpha subunit
MSTCPKCGVEIHQLNNFQSMESKYSLDEKGDYEFRESFDAGNTNDYECPECSEVLFTDEDKALEFLQSEPKQATDI